MGCLPLLALVTQKKKIVSIGLSTTHLAIYWLCNTAVAVSRQEKNATVLSLICTAVGNGTPALPCLEYQQHVIRVFQHNIHDSMI